MKATFRKLLFITIILMSIGAIIMFSKDGLHLTVENNTAKKISDGGKAIDVSVPSIMKGSINVSNNHIDGVSGNTTAISIGVTDNTKEFIRESGKHFHDLSPEQQKEFNRALEILKSDQKEDGYKMLRDIASKVVGTAISYVITDYLKSVSF